MKATSVVLAQLAAEVEQFAHVDDVGDADVGVQDVPVEVLVAPEHHVDEGAGAHAELGVVFHDQVGLVVVELLLHQQLMAEEAAFLARPRGACDGVALDIVLVHGGKAGERPARLLADGEILLEPLACARWPHPG